MRAMPRRAKREPTISLINIVFLILIFFMITGTLTRPTSSSLAFVQTQGLECCAGEGVLEVTIDGEAMARGQRVMDLPAYLDALSPGDRTVRLLPDQRLPAQTLLRLVADLRAQGAERILIVTENTAS